MEAGGWFASAFGATTYGWWRCARVLCQKSQWCTLHAWRGSCYGKLGGRWFIQHVLQDQDWPCSEVALPGILGAWNAQTGDWEHRYQGGNHHFHFLINVIFILSPGGYMEKLFLKEQFYGNV
jgi:hypothetical protein